MTRPESFRRDPPRRPGSLVVPSDTHAARLPPHTPPRSSSSWAPGHRRRRSTPHTADGGTVVESVAPSSQEKSTGASGRSRSPDVAEDEEVAGPGASGEARPDHGHTQSGREVTEEADGQGDEAGGRRRTGVDIPGVGGGRAEGTEGSPVGPPRGAWGPEAGRSSEGVATGRGTVTVCDPEASAEGAPPTATRPTERSDTRRTRDSALPARPGPPAESGRPLSARPPSPWTAGPRAHGQEPRLTALGAGVVGLGATKSGPPADVVAPGPAPRPGSTHRRRVRGRRGPGRSTPSRTMGAEPGCDWQLWEQGWPEVATWARRGACASRRDRCP